MTRSILIPSLLAAVTFYLARGHGGEDTHHFSWDFLLKFSTPFENSMELWTYAFVSTAVISAAPFFLLFFIPIQNARQHSSLLKVLLSFASGGLLGDAFLHLIPHAISPHNHGASGDVNEHGNIHGNDNVHHHDDGHDHHHHDHAHDHMKDMIVGLWVLAGIISFLAVEKFVRLAKGSGHSHHSHAHISSPEANSAAGEEIARESSRESGGNSVRRRKEKASTHSSAAPPPPQTKQPQGKKRNKDAKKKAEIKVSAYLNLVADFAHNFTDGLAIGASYLVGRGVGLVTTFTILLHEIPHEIGDFAILIQSGYSRRSAIFFQLGTAVGAMAGTACGLFLEGAGSSASTWVLPFTAGGFIYIATVAVIPELLEKSGLWQSLVELVAMAVGIAMMVLITFVE